MVLHRLQFYLEFEILLFKRFPKKKKKFGLQKKRLQFDLDSRILGFKPLCYSLLLIAYIGWIEPALCTLNPKMNAQSSNEYLK